MSCFFVAYGLIRCLLLSRSSDHASTSSSSSALTPVTKERIQREQRRHHGKPADHPGCKRIKMGNMHAEPLVKLINKLRHATLF